MIILKKPKGLRKILDKLGIALELAFNELKKEFGEDAKLDEGEDICAVFNDGALIVGVQDNQLQIKVILNHYIINSNMDILGYEKE